MAMFLSELGRRLTRRTVLAGLGAAMLAPRAFAQGGSGTSGEIRIPHAFGEAVLPGPATRVVSLGFTTQDALLALGIVPVGIRHWFGDQPDAVWPWAHDLLQGQTPTVLAGEVSPEAVAALQPDLIVAIGSGITQAEHAVLSQIAPTIVQAEGQPTYGTSWDEAIRVIGQAVGREREAAARVEAMRAEFAAVRARHPDWAGRSAVAGYHFAGETGGFTSRDTRGSFLRELGFEPAPEIDRLAGDNFYAAVSPEDLSPLDVDLLLWVSSGTDVSDLAALPLRRLLPAHLEGREVLASDVDAAALSFGSVLSMPFALARLEEEMAAALDGDPATPVASAVSAGLAP